MPSPLPPASLAARLRRRGAGGCLALIAPFAAAQSLPAQLAPPPAATGGVGLAQPMLMPAPQAPAATVAAPMKADGTLRYALGAGANYASGTLATLASANVGGEGVVATTETRLRFGAKALWSRTINEAVAADTTTLLLTEETQHRWRGRTWFRQQLSVYPAVRAGEIAHGVLDTGIAITMTPLCDLSLGVKQRYDTLASWKPADTTVFTGLALKLR